MGTRGMRRYREGTMIVVYSKVHMSFQKFEIKIKSPSATSGETDPLLVLNVVQ